MNRKTLRAVLACAVPLALLVWLAYSGALAGIERDLQQIHAGVVAATVCCMTISLALRAKRLQLEFRASKHLPFVDAQRIILIHNLAINLLPFRSGEFSLPYFLRQHDIPLGASLVSLLKLRLQDAVILGLLAVLLYPRLLVGVQVFIVLAAVTIVLLACRLPQSQTGWLAQKFAVFSVFLRLHELTPETWLLSLANWLVKMLGVAIVFLNLLDTSLMQGLAAAAGGEVSALLPLPSIGSFGQYEVGSAFFLAPEGAGSWGALLRCALIAHSLTFVTAVSYGLLALAFNGFRLLKNHE